MTISLYPKLTPHVKAQVSPVPVPWCQRAGTFISQPREPVQSTVQVNRKIDHLCMQCCCVFEGKYMGGGGGRHKASSPRQSMALSTRVSLCFIIFISRKKELQLLSIFTTLQCAATKSSFNKAPFHHKGLCSYFFCCSC